MKRLVAAALLPLFFCFFQLAASAAELPEAVNDIANSGLEASGANSLADSLPGETRDMLSDMDLEKPTLEGLLKLEPKAFLRAVGGIISEKATEPIRVLFSIIGALILCALVSALVSPIQGSAVLPVFSAVTVIAVIMSMIDPVSTAIMSTAEALKSCQSFMLSFIPVFTSVVTVSGAPVAAGSYNVLLFGVCQLVSVVASEILVPFMGLYMGLCIVGGVGEDIGVMPIAKGVKSMVTWALTLMMTAYVGLLSMQTLVSSGADSAMLKTGKFLIGSFVPVVGGAISEAVGAAKGALSLIRTTVGAFGVVALLLMFLPTVLEVFIWQLSVKFCGFVADSLGLLKPRVILSACGDCLGTMLAILISFMLLVIVSVLLLLSMLSGV